MLSGLWPVEELEAMDVTPRVWQILLDNRRIRYDEKAPRPISVAPTWTVTLVETLTSWSPARSSSPLAGYWIQGLGLAGMICIIFLY